MLKQRVISSVVLISIFIGMPWLPPMWFKLVMAVLVMLAAWELAQLIVRIAELKKTPFTAGYLLLIAIFLIIGNWLAPTVILLVAGIWWLLASGLIMSYPRFSGNWNKHSIVLSIAGGLVLIPAWKALVVLQASEMGPVYILYFLLLIGIADSSAFFAGRQWGKTKLAPKLSPGKSWQGVYAALLSSLLVSGLASHYFGFYHFYLVWFSIIAVITVAASIFGDLFESMLKREAGVKDSGRLIPGHGGILDRIDSICSGAPVFVLCLQWLKGW